MIVIDSNIFAKLFIAEHDSAQAKDFLKYCIRKQIPLLAPSLFTYEVIQIALYYDFSTAKVLDTIDASVALNLTLLEPTREHWLEAEKMVQSGHKKSGFPSLYDSAYHVLALSNNCTFLTADKRHEAKTKQFGSIKTLDQWKELF